MQNDEQQPPIKYSGSLMGGLNSLDLIGTINMYVTPPKN